jgi:hypothetical protein
MRLGNAFDSGRFEHTSNALVILFVALRRSQVSVYPYGLADNHVIDKISLCPISHINHTGILLGYLGEANAGTGLG